MLDGIVVGARMCAQDRRRGGEGVGVSEVAEASD